VKQGCGGEEVRNRKKEDDRGEWPTSGASENRRDGIGRKKTKHMSVRPHRVSWLVVAGALLARNRGTGAGGSQPPKF
jgi:hypothetical protein